MKCLYESYEDKGVEFKQAILDYENLLIQQEFLKGKSGKNYKEAIGLLIENKDLEYLPSTSFNTFVSTKVRPNILKLIECQKVFIDSSVYDLTKLNAFKKTVENQISYSEINPHSILRSMDSILSENDYENHYYKLQTFNILSLFIIDRGLLRTLPKANYESTKEKDLSNALSIYIDEKNTISINDEKSSLKEIRETVRNYYLKNTSESIVTLNYNSGTSFSKYIALQNEITNAINSLREKLALKLYKKDLDSLTREELTTIKEKYPLNLIEKSLD
ncbi:hypothetical protein [Winogradskyella sp. SYSU M77433]|uniref:ExbD/TolR family protein n=1 Tax=Winogradskyella sp. SYSU M77433 TaxID=3042722 RepID=UPI002480CE8E|nr:hypothetical protein [Winogradskyella sp. SYSU M77433]